MIWQIFCSLGGWMFAAAAGYDTDILYPPASTTSIPIVRHLTTYSRCPSGFVLPEDPTDTDVEFVVNSNCAIGCKSPILGPDTWQSAIGFVKTVNLLGVICLILLFLSFSSMYTGVDKPNRDSFTLVFLICMFSCASTVLTCGQRQRPFEDQFCRDNATPITAADGVTFCAVESFVNMYTGVALALAWAVQSFQIMWVLVFRRPVPLSNATIVAVLVLAPLLVNVAAFSRGVQGYSRGNVLCFTSESAGNGDIYYFFMPIFVVGCFGVLFMCVAMYQILNMLNQQGRRSALVSPASSSRAEDNRGSSENSRAGSDIASGNLNSPSQADLTHAQSMQQTSALASLRALYLPLMFVVFFLFCIFGLVMGRAEVWSHAAAREELFDEWVVCVFDHYDGVTDASWRSHCGDEPPDDGVNKGIGMWFGLAAMGHSIFVTIAFIRYKEICVMLLSLRQRIFRFWIGESEEGGSTVPSFLEFDADAGDSKRGSLPKEDTDGNGDGEDYVHAYTDDEPTTK